MKRLCIMFIVLAIIIVSLGSWAQDEFQYPAGCISREQKLEYLRELKEALRVWYNERTVGLTASEVNAFFKDEFLPRDKKLQKLINDMIDVKQEPDGSYIKNMPALRPVPIWNADASVLGKLKIDTKVAEAGELAVSP